MGRNFKASQILKNLLGPRAESGGSTGGGAGGGGKESETKLIILFFVLTCLALCYNLPRDIKSHYTRRVQQIYIFIQKGTLWRPASLCCYYYSCVCVFGHLVSKANIYGLRNASAQNSTTWLGAVDFRKKMLCVTFSRIDM